MQVLEDAQNALDGEYSDLRLHVVDGYSQFWNTGSIDNVPKFNLSLSDQEYPAFTVMWHSKRKEFENLRFMYDYNRRSVLKDTLSYLFYYIAPNFSTLTFEPDYSDSLLWKASVYMFEPITKDSLYKLDFVKDLCDIFATNYRLPRFEAEVFFVDTLLFPFIHHEYFFDRPFDEFSQNDEELFCSYSSNYKYRYRMDKQGRVTGSLDIANAWMFRDTVTAACNVLMAKKYPENDYYKMHEISLELDTTDFSILVTDKYLIRLIESKKDVEHGFLTGKFDLETKQTKIKGRMVL